MRRAQPCLDNAEVIFDEIRAHRTHIASRHIISRIRHDVLSAYSSYVAATPDLQALVSICSTEAQRSALKDFYDKTTKPRVDLIKRVYSNQEDQQCPYCTIDSVGSIDHYLARATHPSSRYFRETSFRAVGSATIHCRASTRRVPGGSCTSMTIPSRKYQESYVPVSRCRTRSSSACILRVAHLASSDCT